MIVIRCESHRPKIASPTKTGATRSTGHWQNDSKNLTSSVTHGRWQTKVTVTLRDRAMTTVEMDTVERKSTPMRVEEWIASYIQGLKEECSVLRNQDSPSSRGIGEVTFRLKAHTRDALTGVGNKSCLPRSP